ncbi:protein of unknown function DUF475 [Desulfurobacterium thermolithotrophum DSM 11699]|uniref:Integral membrane protein TerC n=1 Tax=Desulfurobacterium thermolithotrophum (strain DSM 11699 / BSA) TaxID=868864 RepID=F0S1N8_DESTD|nr:DUF475 domain-containing protein [Desulfurobacterium thermolithotrophum]ADY72893.1 protein of unknown function DUF475 [Desulfurobacterium thermolithotrophum DSM 11699]
MTFRRLLLEFTLVLIISWIIEFFYMGVKGIFEGTTLSLLEISLSFDNAVMNAVVLSGMSYIWRRRFLTWGMIIAVFGMRFLFPVLIVSLTAGIGIEKVTEMAFSNPEEYAHYLEIAEPLILSFGGSFLLMVFINWLFDAGKELYWIRFLEEKAAKLAKVGEIKLIVALTVVFIVGFLKKDSNILLAMILGILLFELVHFIKGAIEYFKRNSISSGGLANFIYLELLDASCSLDGAVGAFAISQNLIIITLGLSVGAFILRSLTVYFVESGKLRELPYLEHGAHWGIGGLGIMMLAQLFHHIPEPVISTVALVFILSSLYTSIRKTEHLF